MVLLTLRGVQVDFPYEPYPCQIEYMTKNIEALQTGENALLESPTGTGKTLCLLCSALAYQRHIKLQNEAQLMYEEAINGTDQMRPSVNGNGKLNKLQENIVILYASRTHSQLTQVVKELKNTSYRPSLCVLGSRDQLCIHEKYSKFKGSKLNNLCNITTKQHKCDKKNNLDKSNRGKYGSFGAHPVNQDIWDIEDIVNNVGKKLNMCPYFYSRDFIKNAELVLLPYNYLLDISIRKTMDINHEESGGSGINFARSVIIFDEAHNLERIASDASSVTLTSADIAECIKELKQTLQLLKSGEHSKVYDHLSLEGKKKKKLPVQEEVVLLLKGFFDLESRIDHIPLEKGLGTTPSCVMPGDWMADVFELCGFTYQNIRSMVVALNSCSDFIMEIQVRTLGPEAIAVNLAVPKMTFFMEALMRIFRYSNKIKNKATLSEHYKVFVCYEDTKHQKSHNSNKNTDKRIINFWCFSPGLAMEEFKEMCVKSIILTSGTLSPMDSFKEDMKISFTIQLENPHVISNSQVWVGALGVGTNGNKLNSSYAFRDTNEYKDELGMTILHLIETMQGKGVCTNSIVSTSLNDYQNSNVVASLKGPDIKGGVLVFFPSYTIMDSMISRWKEVGNPSLFERLKSIAGNIIVEPRARVDVTAATNSHDGSKSNNGKYTKNFEDKVPTIMDDGESNVEKELMISLVKVFESTLSINGRCLLLAVCRGKVSEGIDFKDERGRLVIITGIPYAPHVDPWIVLKRENLDQKLKKWKQKSSGNTTKDTSSTMSNNSNLSYQQLMKDSMVTQQQPFTASVPSNNGVIPPYIPLKYPQNTNNDTVFKVNIDNSVINKTKSDNVPSQSSSIGSMAPSLDGQSWYNQAASRAVNQAIGRVIRHKNDWGAIFLLDDRFLYEKQMKELSKWLRSRVVKFPSNAKASLIDFRKFITAAHNDPALRPVPLVVVNSSSSATNYKSSSATSTVKTDNSNSVFSKEIFIDASALKSDDNSEGLTFIDPTLLLSQVPNDNNFNSIRSSSSSSTNNNSRNTSIVDNVRSLNMVKTRVNVPAVPVIFSSIFGQSKPINTAAKAMPFVGHNAAKSFDLTVVKKENDDDIGPLLKGLIGEMKSKLNVEVFSTFKGIMHELNQEQEEIFQEESKIQEFIEKLLRLFTLAKLPSNMSKQWLMRLSNLVPKDNDKDKLYRQLVIRITDTTNISNQPTKRPLEPNIKMESDAKIPRSDANSNSSLETSIAEKPAKPTVVITDVITDAAATAPNVPSKIVAPTISSKTTNNTKLSISSTQESVYSQPYSQRAGDRGSRNMAALTQNKGTNDKSLFAPCPICMETLKDPCAGKCGHIFCSICMNGWLHRKQECPVCKRPTTYKDVAKIKIK